MNKEALVNKEALESFSARIAGVAPMKLAEMGLELLPKIIGVVLLLCGAWFLAAWVRRATLRALTRTHFDVTLTKFFSNLARWVILTVAGISVLGIFGVQATSFAAIIAAAGLAVGLAFQGTLSNFASGVMLLVFRPFRVGDWVKVAGQVGRVDEIDLFTTTLDTADRRRIMIPNTAIFGTTIENSTYHSLRRVDADLSVDSGFPLDKVRSLLTEASLAVEGAVSKPDAEVTLLNVTMVAVEWRLSVWAPSPNYDLVRTRLLARIKLVVDALKNGRDTIERPA